MSTSAPGQMPGSEESANDGGDVQPAAPVSGIKSVSLDEKLATVTTPQQMDDLLQEINSGAATFTETSPAAEASDEEAALGEDADAEGEPEAGETPEMEQQQGDDESPEASESEDGQDEDEGKQVAIADPTKSEAGKHKRFRITPRSEEDQAVLALMKSNLGLTMAQALELVRKNASSAKGKAEPQEKSGEKPTDTERPAEDKQAPDSPETASLRQQLKAKQAERRKASSQDFDIAKADEIQAEIDELQVKLAKAEFRDELARRDEEERQRNEIIETFENSKREAIAMYPDLTRTDSALSKRVAELDGIMRDTGNPLYDDPNKAKVLAMMAANELRIAPRSPAAKPASTQAAPKRSGTRPVPPVATPGASRPAASKTTFTSQQQAAFEKELEQIRTPDQLEDFLAKLTR